MAVVAIKLQWGQTNESNKTKCAEKNQHKRQQTRTHKISTFRDKYLCNYMNDIVFCGSPHIKIMNNGFGYFARMQEKNHQQKQKQWRSFASIPWC